MSLPVETVGGWTWYVAQWKEKHPDTKVDYKALLQQYIKGVKLHEELDQHTLAGWQAIPEGPGQCHWACTGCDTCGSAGHRNSWF
ncbi:hypothetical protein phiK7A1_001c [Pseudomonas phage phiK7A1]|uniref:Uncharacterized protein n=1 Tax=Pseudomonas phage phiK7A1 TaxID=2759194 RepID=A0A7H0XFK1_9CAUD|nr:hypothetical protein phiK7A1_001c [Pseudomonas phage phiK7A1]